uniref:Uncharacterized protein n=1 Tax=Anguilla anguilla TaxID=7936 RepID=A0A0E9R0F5_ANGAN
MFLFLQSLWINVSSYQNNKTCTGHAINEKETNKNLET